MLMIFQSTLCSSEFPRFLRITHRSLLGVIIILTVGVYRGNENKGTFDHFDSEESIGT